MFHCECDNDYKHVIETFFFLITTVITIINKKMLTMNKI